MYPLQYKYLQSSCDKKIQDLDHLVEDKDKRIKELLHHLKHITGENAVFEPVPRPPGMARRTASIGVQTNCDKPEAHADCTTQETSLSCEDVVSLYCMTDLKIQLHILHNRKWYDSNNVDSRKNWQRK